MLVKRTILDAIVRGEVSIVFRRWKRPTVKKGGTLRTQVGVLSIDAVDEIHESKVRLADCKRAGFSSVDEMTQSLAQTNGARLFRVKVSFLGEDPRIALRENKDVEQDEFEAIQTKLDAMDRRSKQGNWTRNVLRAIKKAPGKRAADLCEDLGYEITWLKPNVRKLKELGLTISLSPGYRLSPRGEAVLKRLKK